MPITETQLVAWSNLGGTTASIATHNAIRDALEDPQAPLRNRAITFLQGSYRNSTNIRGDSDVDIVVQLNETYYYDTSALPLVMQTQYSATRTPATYTESAFKNDVRLTLERRFGRANITQHNKVFIVSAGNGRIEADVLPALQFQRIVIQQNGLLGYVEGIRFTDTRGKLVTNYPKQHIDNGQDKNSVARTNGWYKPTVRMFKNARNAAVQKGLLAENVAASYFVECLLYNVPDHYFGNSYQDTFINIVNFIKDVSSATCVCQNGELALFGVDSTQWTVTHGSQFVAAMIALWNTW